jgi:hypothetical protein
MAASMPTQLERRSEKMKRLSVLGAILAVAVMSTLNGVASAGINAAPGPVAGSLSDGTIYVTSPDDAYWYPVSPAEFKALGYTYNDVTWYGSTTGLPGSIVPGSTATPNLALAQLAVPPVNLVGLTSTGVVYLDKGDGSFHPVTAAQMASNGYSYNWVKWYGQLPGSIASS